MLNTYKVGVQLRKFKWTCQNKYNNILLAIQSVCGYTSET